MGTNMFKYFFLIIVLFKAILGGNWWVPQGFQCRRTEDCPCRFEEERCSCINGKCVPDPEKGECDIDYDCRNNMKCREGNCACVGNICQKESLICKFTKDCSNYTLCKNIADAYCKCNFGKCILAGSHPWIPSESQCNNYKDCPCRGKREACFCRDGKCLEEKWECHIDGDCVYFEKCKHGNCACVGNTCESECLTTADCKDSYCSNALGYQCRCENFQCKFEKKYECNRVSDCWRKGLCGENKPCICLNDVCTKPYWYDGTNQNCRNNQDCEMIRNCRGNNCQCRDVKKISKYEERGTCKPIWWIKMMQ